MTIIGSGVRFGGRSAVFPAGAVARKGKLILYAGAGDKYVIFLSCSLDGLVDYLWKHCACAS